MILIFLLLTTLLVSTSIIGYQASLHSYATIELKELLGIYQNRFSDSVQHWEHDSSSLKSVIDSTNLLNDPATRWERLTSLLAILANDQYFSHIIITDKTGKCLFSFGGGARHFQFFSPDGSTPAWYLDKKTTTLYRVFRQPIILGTDGVGYLITFHPLTNSVLHRSTAPRTQLFLRSGSVIVASSIGASGVERGMPIVGSGNFVTGSIHLGTEADAPDLLVYRQFPEIFSITDLTAAVGLCLLLMFGLLWGGIGSWVITLSRRVTALGSIAHRHIGTISHPAAADTASTAICHAQRDEISAAATALEEMTALLMERDRELSKLALVARETSEMVTITDSKGMIEWVNEGFTRQTGYTLQDMIGRKPGTVLQGEESDPRIAAYIERKIAECRPYTVQIRNYDKAGNGYWAEIKAQPVVNEQGKLVRYISVETDISPRKRAQDRLQLLSKVFYYSNEGIVVTDPNATIIAVNESFCRLTGYSRHEAMGQNPRILKSGREDAAFYAAMWETIAVQGHWHGEIWDRRKDGSVYPKLLMIFAVKKAGGEISNYVGSFTDITEQKLTEDKIMHLAHHDPLTGLPNRFTVLDRLDNAISHGRRNNSAVAVIFIDLDRFKEINDTFGHDVGDDLLIQVAGRLQGQVRESDTVARLGGDEFVIVLPEISGPNSATHVAEKILRVIGAPFISGEHTLHTTPSIGIAIFPNDGDDLQTVMKNADAAMYRAKTSGRNNIRYFSEESYREQEE